MIYNAFTGNPLGETPAVFAGVGVDNPHSGPNGNIIAGYQLWAGDYPSTRPGVRFEVEPSRRHPRSRRSTRAVCSWADEMDYDPADKIVAVSNGEQAQGILRLSR